MLQLRNDTPFKAVMSVFSDAAGVDTLYVAVKATFTLRPRLDVSRDQASLTLGDVYWGDPARSSLRYASDIHLAKPGTDVVLIGHARSPSGHPVPALDATLAVAERAKTIRVFGTRVWKGGVPSAPEPFIEMPLVYELAYGGVRVVDADRGELAGEGRNPVGRGYTEQLAPESVEGLPLPNLEDPRRPIQAVGAVSDPACFGFVAASWLPRRAFAGTYDETWQRERAPYLPGDFDPRFFQAAHPDLAFDRHLQGGEPIALTALSREGPMAFTLPACTLDTTVRIAGRTETPPLRLETVLIEPDDGRLSLLWRAALPCDKQALRVEQVTVGLRGLTLEGRVG